VRKKVESWEKILGYAAGEGEFENRYISIYIYSKIYIYATAVIHGFPFLE